MGNSFPLDQSQTITAANPRLMDILSYYVSTMWKPEGDRQK